MCNSSCINFGKSNLNEGDIRGKSVIEVGSLDVNGSLRPYVQSLGPSDYTGVDIQMGRGVDRICKVEDLVATFGANSFDVVICTELMEHVGDWSRAVHNLKQILKPMGALLITTRSRGFEYHGYPFDFWRYEPSDMEFIFSDFDIKSIGSDQEAPGVYLAARKPPSFSEKDVKRHKLYSILIGARTSIAKSKAYWIMVFLPLCRILGKKRWIKLLKK